MVTVLLVEDDEGDALLVQDQLAGLASRVDVVRARTLREALASLGPEIDCVLLDLGLPDAVGLDALARVRAARPALAVVVLTGLDDEDAGVAAVHAGAQDYLIKGRVRGDVLLRAIRYAIGRRQAEDARRELEIAAVQAQENARLERGLLPRPIVDDRSIRVTSCSRPGRRRTLLGGDFHDVVETADGVLHVLIGDVCGHGPDEAALGVCLRTSWRALVLSGADGDLVLETLQGLLQRERHLPHLFATACVLDIEPGRRALRMHRAGHLAPLLIDGRAVTPLPELPGGRPLGLATDGWPEVRVDLPERWSLLLFTDGLTEARVAGDLPLGDERLVELISEHLVRDPGSAVVPGAPLEDLIERVEAQHGGPLRDDVALLLLESRPGRPGEG